MAMKEHMPNKADTTRLRSSAKHIFNSFLDFRSYLEASGPNHNQFL